MSAAPVDFRCPHCRGRQYRTVTVPMPSGQARTTPFFACNSCSAMFLDPQAFTLCDPSGTVAQYVPAGNGWVQPPKS